jgi:ribosomal protein S18 acetylase RimI-like enzyme
VIASAPPEIQEDLTLEEERGQTSVFAPFLEKVEWGTEGARYRLEDYEATLQHLPDPIYFTLRRNRQLIALRLILGKELQMGSEMTRAFYHSFFSVTPEEKGRGHGRRLAKATLETFLPRLGPKGLIYSHVEVENARSASIHEALGYRNIGRFSAMSFCRLFPKTNSRITRLTPNQKALAIRALQKQYSGHAWTDFPSSFDPENFYVLAEGDDLIAGVQVLRQRWTILDLGGFGGALAIKALPHIPILRGVFNPQDFRFLKFGNIFYREGRAADAYKLWEGVLAMHGLKTAMLFMDPASPVTQTLRAAGSLGFLNALTETPVNIFAMFRGFSENQIESLSQQPKCISPLDL